VFGELLRRAIEDAEAMFDHPLKQYALFKAFEDQVAQRHAPGVPDELADQPHARACYGAMRLVLGEEGFAGLDGAGRRALVERARQMEGIVQAAVAEHSLNPQNIEAAIRQGLLPMLFTAFGLDRAKQIVEEVVQIARVGLGRA
jgi:type I restriction enzyme R subunit